MEFNNRNRKFTNHMKVFKRVSLISVFVILQFGMSVQAQVDPNIENLRNPVPPSPNVSSLGKFGEWPVSLYTGLPGISVPVYELKGRSMTVPISIGYHAAGNRVGEIASWVGLGWALNAGGCISRTVLGLPDEDSYFQTASNYYNRNLFCTGGVINSTYLDMATGGAAQGTWDTQQDIYNLNVLGKSYRIVFSAVDSSAYTMPYSNIKITSNFMKTINNSSASTWQVILEDGTQLLFGGALTGTNPYVEQTSNVRYGGNFISAWYLQSMTSTTGEVINFTYTPSTITQDTHLSQSDYVSYFTNAIVVGSNGFAAFINSNLTKTNVELQTVTQLSLSTIESDLARVYFIPSTQTRSDLNGGVSLSEIKVLSKINNTYIEDWLFNYTYSRAAPGNELPSPLTQSDSSYAHQRLKLTSLQRKPMDGSPMQTWSFGYNPLSLPSRRSCAQDHWGFYNGAVSNVSLLPKIQFNPALCPLYSNYGYYPFTNEGFMGDIGEQRSGNETYMQAEMLNQITYPTGGYTQFNFEGNKQPVYQEVFGDTTANFNLYLTYNQSNFNNTLSFPFVLTKPEYVYVNFSSSISQTVYNDYPGAKVWASILDSAGNSIGSSIVSNGTSWFNVYKPGHYYFQLSSNCVSNNFSTANDIVSATATFRYFPSYGFQNTQQLLGGVRLNNMQEFDGVTGTPIGSKYYQYESAFVINPVDTVNAYLTSQSIIKPVNPDGSQYEYLQLTRNTSSKFSLGSIQGGTVGYGKVTTKDGYNGINGYTVSRFTCDPATQAFLPASLIFPYPPADALEWRNGLLASEITYTASGAPVKALRNSYNFIQEFRYNNFVVGYATLNQNPNICGSLYGACGSITDCFNITNEWMQHTSATQIAYNTATGDSLVSTTNYYYDDALNEQPVHTTSYNSKGDSIVSYKRTALEMSAINASIPLTTTATAALDTMLSRNMVSIPIESEKYTQNILTGKTLSNYKLESNGFVEPDNVMIQNASNPLETRIFFDRYDSKGNLLEQMKINDQKHDYIWDYQYSYPVAQIVNADSVSVAYTSFEADGTGNWAVSSSARDSVTPAITGYKSYNLANGSISTSMALTSSRTYILSYWSKNGSYTVTGGGTPKQGKTISVNGTAWTYYEYTISGVTGITVSGSGNIDELRLYPSTAQMTTYTYNPLIGMSSQCDVNNRISYYNYDGYNRLYTILDQDRNVLKKYCYNYAGQSIACTQFYNNAKSGVFTRNNCGTGYTGGSVTYTVAAGKYASLVSQNVADSLAQNDVNVNGQNYANANGICTSSGYSITATNTTGLSGFTATYTNTSTLVQTVFSIPAAGGVIGTLAAGTYNVTLAKTGNSSTKYIYTVCTNTHAAAVTATFSGMVIGSSCNTVEVDTVN